EKVVGGTLGIISRGVEADEIGQGPLAEKRLDLRALMPDAPGLEELEVIDGPAARGGVLLKAFEEIAFVGPKILNAAFRHERDDFRRNRTFRGPEAGGGLAENTGVLLLREAKLLAQVFRRVKTSGQMRLGLAAAGQLRIDNKRRDRMEESGCGQLNLAA